MREAVESGEYRPAARRGLVAPDAVRRASSLIHMTRIPNVDATDPEQLTRAEVEGRRQVREYHRFLRDRVPGFERSVDRRHVARRSACARAGASTATTG